MPEITFPLSSAPGVGKQESGGRLLNAYTEKLGDNARAKTVRRRVPGLDRLTTVDTYSHCRGFHWSNNVLYKALDERLVKITEAAGVYTVTDLGALAGTGPVMFAQNNAVTTAIQCVTENGAFNVLAAAAPTAFVDPDLPNPNSVTRVGGYFVWTTGFGDIVASGLNVTTVAALSKTTAQSRADTLLRGVTFGGRLYACGQTSIEVYNNVGTSPFPLAFEASILRGLKGKWAVAGFEEGWANELIWVGDDNRVYKLIGYRPDPISTSDVERDIAAITDADTIEACVYVSAGNAIWSLKSPTWCWEYNLTTGLWHERESYLETTWRASRTIRAFDKWVCGDDDTGKLFAINEATHTEDGDPLIWRVESSPASNFPGGVSIPRVDFDFEAGVGAASGEAIEIDPQVNISWSDNGGATWSSPIQRPLGRMGKYNRRVTVNRTGTAGPKGRMWRLEAPDPARIGFYGGTFEAEAAA